MGRQAELPINGISSQFFPEPIRYNRISVNLASSRAIPIAVFLSYLVQYEGTFYDTTSRESTRWKSITVRRLVLVTIEKSSMGIFRGSDGYEAE
jgi:hypothetical protein